MENKIYTPTAQGTLEARLVWDNETETDGIEVSLIRENGQEDVLFKVLSCEEGLSYNVMLPFADMIEDAVINATSDDENEVLYLETCEKDGNDDGSDNPTPKDDR